MALLSREYRLDQIDCSVQRELIPPTSCHLCCCSAPTLRHLPSSLAPNIVGQPNVYSCTVFHSLKLPPKLLQTALALLPPTLCFLSHTSCPCCRPTGPPSLYNFSPVQTSPLSGCDLSCMLPGPSSRCSKHVYNHTCVHLRATDPSLETENDAWRC